jgi:hypothetical protein
MSQVTFITSFVKDHPSLSSDSDYRENKDL